MPLFSSTAGISARALGLTSGILSGAAAITSILGNQNGTTGTQLLVYFNAGTPGSSPVTDYQYSLNGGSTWNTFASPQTSSPLTITGLTNGTTYSVAIRPMQGLQASIPSNTASGRPVALPSTPSISSITNDANGTTGTHISVEFTGGTGGTDSTTNFQFSTDNGSTWTTRSPAATSSPILITGLTNGTSYNVRVRAVTSIGDVSASSAASTGRPVALPGAPTISGITASTGQLSVAFSVGQAGTDAPSTYEYSLDGGSTWLGRQTGTTASPIVITGITDSTVANANKSLSPTYSVRIRSVTPQSHRSAQSAAVTPSATIAAAPTNLVATVTPTSISVTFTSAAAGSYAINRHQYSIDNGSTWATYTSGQAIGSLLPSTQYTVQIRAVDAQELAGTSASVTTTTSAEVAPTAPTITSVTSSSTTSLTVAYTSATQGTYAIDGYEYSTDGTTWASAGASPFTISGLAVDTQYTVRLRAFSSYTPSGGTALRGPEATALMQTKPPIPDVPTVRFGSASTKWGPTTMSTAGQVSANMTINSYGSGYLRIAKASYVENVYVAIDPDVGSTTYFNLQANSSLFYTDPADTGFWVFKHENAASNRVYTYSVKFGNRLSTDMNTETSAWSNAGVWTMPKTSQAWGSSASPALSDGVGVDNELFRTDVNYWSSCLSAYPRITMPTFTNNSAIPGYKTVTNMSIKLKCGTSCNLQASSGSVTRVVRFNWINGTYQLTNAMFNGGAGLGSTYVTGSTGTIANGTNLSNQTLTLELLNFGNSIPSNCTGSGTHIWRDFYVWGTQTTTGSLSPAAGVAW